MRYRHKDEFWLFFLCGGQRKDILAELTKSQKVFSEKLDHLSRRLAWVHATIYSQVSSHGPSQYDPFSASLFDYRLDKVVLGPLKSPVFHQIFLSPPGHFSCACGLK